MKFKKKNQNALLNTTADKWGFYGFLHVYFEIYRVLSNIPELTYREASETQFGVIAITVLSSKRGLCGKCIQTEGCRSKRFPLHRYAAGCTQLAIQPTPQPALQGGSRAPRCALPIPDNPFHTPSPINSQSKLFWPSAVLPF
jgi:hypothetical protein